MLDADRSTFLDVAFQGIGVLINGAQGPKSSRAFARL